MPMNVRVAVACCGIFLLQMPSLAQSPSRECASDCASSEKKMELKRRPSSIFWIYKELFYVLLHGMRAYKEEFGEQIATTNGVVFREGECAIGTFVPRHALDYLLVLRFDGNRSSMKEIKKYFSYSVQRTWQLHVEAEDAKGGGIASFEMMGENFGIEDCYFEHFSLFIGRIDCSPSQKGKRVKIKVECLKSADQRLLELIKRENLRVSLRCDLPFYPMDM